MMTQTIITGGCAATVHRPDDLSKEEIERRIETIKAAMQALAKARMKGART